MNPIPEALRLAIVLAALTQEVKTFLGEADVFICDTDYDRSAALSDSRAELDLHCIPDSEATLAAFVVNPEDTESGPEGVWYCEEHPHQEMGHRGCTAAGIPASARLSMLMNSLRLTKQEVREASRMRDEMAAAARRAALAASPVAQTGQIVAWRVNSVHGNGGWIDGAPTESQIADFRDNAPGATLQYAYGKTEHTPAVVSTNGAESNMTGGDHVAPDHATWFARQQVRISMDPDEAKLLEGWTRLAWKGALRASHGQAPAGAALSIKDANWVRDGIADFLADNWPDKKYTLEQIEAGVRAIEITPSAVRSMPTAQAAPATDRTARWQWSDLRDELGRLSMIASTAMHQNASDQRNILEDLADRLSKLTDTAPAAGAVAGPSVTVRVGAQEFDLASTGEHFTAADMHTASAQAFREGRAATPTPAAQEDADPLQGAANWLAEAHGQFGPAVLQGCLMIGYNRAKRLHDAALAAKGKAP